MILLKDRYNKEILKAMRFTLPDNLFIGGGAIRSIMFDEKINDWDIYGKNEDLKEFEKN